MAKCNQLTPLPFKRLINVAVKQDSRVFDEKLSLLEMRSFQLQQTTRQRPQGCKYIGRDVIASRACRELRESYKQLAAIAC